MKRTFYCASFSVGKRISIRLLPKCIRLEVPYKIKYVRVKAKRNKTR